MQTFVPYPSFSGSASVLDRARLGKQRVEVLQLLRAGLGHTTGGWTNHPALKMWQGHLCALAGYGLAVCDEWIARGYRDTTRPKILALWHEARAAGESVSTPSWWGRDDVHASHQSNLVRKDAEHYGPIFLGIDPTLPYVWPSSHTPARRRKRESEDGTVRPVAAGTDRHTPNRTKEPTVAARNTSRKTKAKTAPAPAEDIEDDLDDVETDDVEDDEVDEAPAPKPAKRAKGKSRKAAADDDDAPAKPAKTKAAKAAKGNGIEAAQAARAANAPKFGTAQLAEHVNSELGTSYTPFQLRAILRRMANDENSTLSRTVGETRERYSFTGPDDERVLELIERLKSGEVERDKKEALDKLKAKSAKGKTKVKAPEPEVEDLDEDDDEELDDDDE